MSQTGDLWLLGRHRLLCGDSTVATDVERVLGGVEPHLMVTDPPYGVNYDAGWRNKAKFSDGKNHRGRAIGKVRITSLWQIAHRKSETGHSTQKPASASPRSP